MQRLVYKLAVGATDFAADLCHRCHSRKEGLFSQNDLAMLRMIVAFALVANADSDEHAEMQR
jgi:uncharacterized protein (UPF0212 family)